MKKVSAGLLLTACVALMGCPGGGNDGGMGGGTGGGATGGGGGGSAGGGSGGGTGGGGGGATGGGGGGGGVTAAQFCGQLAQKYCARESACGWLAASQQSACEAVVTAYCNPQIAAVTAGHRTYDASKVAGCFAAIAADSCRTGRDIDGTGFLYTYSACDAVTGKGAAAIGHPCDSDYDCANGYCPSLNGACRVCVGYVAVGQACDFNKPCDPATAFCNDANVCQTLIAQNMGPCTSSYDCTTGLFCTQGNSDGGTDDGGTRLCVTQLADGQPCASSAECQTGHCNSNSQVPDAGVDVCGTSPVGGPCYFSSDCVTGAKCDYANDVCVQQMTNLPVNSPCVSSFDCASDLWCGSGPDGGSDVCQARVNAGQPCVSDSSCVIGDECDIDLSLCEVIAGAGGPCVDTANGGFPSSDMCSETLFCDETLDGGSCTGWLAVGANCGASSNAVCNDGNGGAGLCNSVDGGMICGSLAGTGTSCTSNYDCASTRCLQTDGGYLDVDPSGTCADVCP